MATKTSRQQRWRALFGSPAAARGRAAIYGEPTSCEQGNPYELHNIPSTAPPAPAVNPFDSLYENPFGSPAPAVNPFDFLYENHFSSPADPDQKDSLQLDNISLDDVKPRPVRPTVTSLRSTRELIRARRAAVHYPRTTSPVRHTDVEIGERNQSKPRCCGQLKMWLILLSLFFLVLVVCLVVAIAMMERGGTLYPYVREGECRVFGGIRTAEWRCEGLEEWSPE